MDKRSQSAKALEQNSSFKNCELNTRHPLGDVYLNNNLWGRSKLRGKPAKLCVFQRNDLYGWKWEMPKNAGGVIGYPAIQYGVSPWVKQPATADFPIQLKDINSLNVDYSTELYVKHRTYNLAFDLWLSSSKEPNKNTITTEIMIWEDWFNFKTHGRKVEDLETPFGTYAVYEGYMDNKKFHQNWQYYAFLRKNERQQGHVDMQFLLQYLHEKFQLNQNDYLTSIELGNEIGNSSGLTMIKEFDVQLN